MVRIFTHTGKKEPILPVTILSRVLEPTFQEVFGALMPDLGQNIAKKIKNFISVVNF